MTEQWREIELYGLKYKVSNCGTFVGARGILKQRMNRDGYLDVTVGTMDKRTTVKVHRIVAILFIENPYDKKEVNHKDFNRANPRADNLEWVTHEENVKHSRDAGNYSGIQLGIKNVKCRLTEKQVLKIRELYDTKELTQMEIAKLYNIGWSTVHNIVFRFTWNHI